ncbi:MAG TPA: type II secretion system F family protein [Candidatus Dormibacteraeota bacterium]|nr:type II secretion system F family protein [Candidatus Dormibacteraeota bacterium]
MPGVVLLVAVGAAIGVGLVVFGVMRRDAEIGALETGVTARVTYRTLADVREQLRRRFEPSGAPVWIAGQNQNALARDLASADLQLRPYEFRLLQIGSALLFAVLAFLRFDVSFAVLILAVVGYVAPAFYLRNRRGHRLRKFDDELPRAMELIANSMKAGQSVAQSFAAVVENAGPPVDEEFGLARREIELGASVESALSNMEKRMGSSDLRLMIMVITIQHAVGGDLPAILTTLADTMRQRSEMRQEVLAATAQSRASSVIITALPILVGAFGYFVLPDYFRPLFTQPIGWVILVVAIALLTTGTVIIRRITAFQ